MSSHYDLNIVYPENLALNLVDIQMFVRFARSLMKCPNRSQSQVQDINIYKLTKLVKRQPRVKIKSTAAVASSSLLLAQQ